MTIRNPIEWGAASLRTANEAVGAAGHSAGHTQEHLAAALPTVRRIKIADLKEVLVKGAEDFAAYRTDVLFLCAIYPIIGLFLGRLAFGYDMLPLLFPLVSGFPLVGPLAAVGLYEMSRRHERGEDVTWAEAFAVMRSPSFGAIIMLGTALLFILVLWLTLAQQLYDWTLGPQPPTSISGFVHDVLGTNAGWALVAIGVGVGFLIAASVLAVSVVSFPLLLDRDVGVVGAVLTSLRVCAANPVPMAAWGVIVAGGLMLGSIPLFLGLVVIMPILGHATWHLYRKTVES